MRTATPALVVMMVLGSPAQAAEVTVRIFSEITFHGLSELTSTSTDATSTNHHAEPPPPARKAGPDGASCQTHDDCRNWCWGGVCAGNEGPPVACRDTSQCPSGLVCWNSQCARPAQPPAATCRDNSHCQQGFVCWNSQCVQSAQPQPAQACSSNQQCAQGFVCWSGQCVQSAQPSPPPASSACTTNDQCAPGLVCVNGACASPPTLQRGTELFLRQRVAQLRQELSFGEGPVITALASFHHVSPDELGRLLKRHRVELTALMDGDDAWAGRFLSRVEELESTCRG